MIYDIITLLIAAVFVIIGAVRGAAKALFGLLSVVLSCVGAVILGRILSVWIYSSFIKEAIVSTVTNSLTDFAEIPLHQVFLPF